MDIFLILLLVVVASAIGTLSGFGTSTLMIPVLALFLSPIEAIFLTSIVHWFGNGWKLVLFRGGFNPRLLILFGMTGVVASFMGAALTLGAAEQMLLRALGAFLVVYALFLVFRPTFRIAASNGMALAGGALSGFFAGFFGVGGAIRAAFLSAFNLPKATFIATIGAIGLVVDTTRITTYILGGAQLPLRLWGGFVFFIPASFLGAWIAKRLVNQIPQKSFRVVVGVFLLIVGLKLAVFP